MMASTSFVESGAQNVLPQTLRADLYRLLVLFEIDVPSYILFAREGRVHFCHVLSWNCSLPFLLLLFVRVCTL